MGHRNAGRRIRAEAGVKQRGEAPVEAAEGDRIQELDDLQEPVAHQSEDEGAPRRMIA